MAASLESHYSFGVGKYVLRTGIYVRYEESEENVDAAVRSYKFSKFLPERWHIFREHSIKRSCHHSIANVHRNTNWDCIWH